MVSGLKLDFLKMTKRKKNNSHLQRRVSLNIQLEVLLTLDIRILQSLVVEEIEPEN